MKSLLSKIRRTLLWGFVLVMPIGVEVDPDHPGELSVSVNGGGGQVITTLRDCSGDVISSERSPYWDLAGSAQLSHRFDSGVVGVFGIRGGTFSAEAGLGEYYCWSDVPPSDGRVTYNYLNPYIALESRYVGIGIGILGAKIPITFGDETGTGPISSHLRFGNYERLHFLATLNENLPLASGGGYINLGVGYPIGKSVQSFTGLSAGFHETPGLVQKLAFGVSDRFEFDLSIRLGATDGLFDGGIAGGVVYHLPMN